MNAHVRSVLHLAALPQIVEGLSVVSRIDRKSSIKTKPRTLSIHQIRYARGSHENEKHGGSQECVYGGESEDIN